MKEFVMAASVTTEYNFKCVMCENSKEEGSIKNGKFVCTECIESLVPKKTHTVAAATAKVTASPYSTNPDGKCANCKKDYGYCHDSVIKKEKWFCGRTCSQIYSLSLTPLPQQTNVWPFQSSLQTVRPISVGHGFIAF
jgi:hypothetical protein